MSEVIKATGGPQYNKLKNLQAKGFAIRKVKEGRETRYFATPPAAQGYEATVTSQGQVTIPKEIREYLHLRAGQKLRFSRDDAGRVAVDVAHHSVRELFGVL